MPECELTDTVATHPSEVESLISHISTAPPPPPPFPDRSLVLRSVIALATASTPTTRFALHSSEADAHSAPLGLPGGMIGTGSDGGAMGGDDPIAPELPPSRYWVAAMTFSSQATGEY